MRKVLLLMLVPGLIHFSCTTNTAFPEREICFNSDWKFLRENAKDAEHPEFDDADWRTVTLPHDYSIEDLLPKENVLQVGPFSEESEGGISTGHVVGGTAWYRKHFTLDREDEGKQITLLFDGVYMNYDVWLNGHHIGNRPYGYSAAAFDLTHHLSPAGEKNVLAVQVKNEGENSRWYSGSGIYRNVTLIKTNPLHIDLWGVFIQTKSVTGDQAALAVDISLANDSREEKSIDLNIEIFGPDGNKITRLSESKAIGAGFKDAYAGEIILKDYRLWSVDDPVLYTLVVQLLDGSTIVDEVREPFGIRTIAFSPETGFLLNGEPVLLKGACLHHDNGPLGAAAFDRAEARKVEIMKKNGFNAIRTAHNPPSRAFLEACDRLGILVMDEAFDMWQIPKKPDDYHLYFDDWWERDLEAMVLRDRNHPSVIIWSIGNEIKERADSAGLEIAEKLKAKVYELDSTRPVTQGICDFWETRGRPWEDSAPAFALLDVHGYNYMWEQYEPDHEKYPERIIIGTESFPMEAFENWALAEKHSYVIGDFVWTGMDYFGESGIGSTRLDNDTISFLPPWPWFNAHCGDLSVLGYKKPQSWFRDVVWRNSLLEMLVHSPVPDGRTEIVSNWGWPDEHKNWNWQGYEGSILQVSVYSRCDAVRLELNGKKVGEKEVNEETKLTARFDVAYEPGELTAVGYKDGQEVVRQVLVTTGKPVRIRVQAEQESLSSSTGELAYFNVDVLDENGLLVPNAEIPVEFSIEGAGTLQAVGNGNPVDMKSFQQPVVTTYKGRCQLIVRCSEEPGEITVTAKSEGLSEGNSAVRVR